MKLIGSGSNWSWYDVGMLERYAIRGDDRVRIKISDDKWEVDPTKRVVGYNRGTAIVADLEGNILNPPRAHQG